MKKEPAITGDEIERLPASGEKPADRPGFVWLQRDIPEAASCEPNWYWGLYKLAPDEPTEKKFGPPSGKRSNQFYH